MSRKMIFRALAGFTFIAVGSDSGAVAQVAKRNAEAFTPFRNT